MNRKSSSGFYGKYFKQIAKPVLFFTAAVFLTLLIYFLYDVPADATGYTILLICISGAALLLLHLISSRRKWKELGEMYDKLPLTNISEANGPVEEAYRKLLLLSEEKRIQLMNDSIKDAQEAQEYYTLWVHQVKTPLSAAHLLIQQQENKPGNHEFCSALRVELFHIEQYAAMALQFQRLNSINSDLAFSEYPLDYIVKKSVKNCAPLFIGQKLPLEITALEGKVVSDEKWLCFVIEQLLTNAIKYSRKGKIAVYGENSTLCIKDSGIGILPEDLPRVFERGFTGTAGRIDSKASGIGLYLCREVCKKLGIDISLESEVGKGTLVRLKFPEKPQFLND